MQKPARQLRRFQQQIEVPAGAAPERSIRPSRWSMPSSTCSARGPTAKRPATRPRPTATTSSAARARRCTCSPVAGGGSLSSEELTNRAQVRCQALPVGLRGLSRQQGRDRRAALSRDDGAGAEEHAQGDRECARAAARASCPIYALPGAARRHRRVRRRHPRRWRACPAPPSQGTRP